MHIPTHRGADAEPGRLPASHPPARQASRRAALRKVLSALLARLSLAVAAAGIMMGCFIVLAHEMVEGETRQFDATVVWYFQHHQTPFFHALMTGISWLAGPMAICLVIAAASLAFWYRGRFWPDGVSLLIAGAGGEALVAGLKALFHRPRPAEVFSHLGYSFPSGHSFFALTVYGMLAYLLTRHALRHRRRWYWGTATVVILLVGFSRVFLGVHYPSDVFAGFAVAVPWLWGCLALPPALWTAQREEQRSR